MTSATWQNSNSVQVGKFSAEMESQLARLRGKFISSLIERILTFEEMKRELQSDCNSAAALQAISGLSHKITGVAATLGFPAIGALSSEMERRIGDGLAKGVSVHETWCDALPVLEELLDEMEGLLEN